jgi:hypothetical protein
MVAATRARARAGRGRRGTQWQKVPVHCPPWARGWGTLGPWGWRRLRPSAGGGRGEKARGKLLFWVLMGVLLFYPRERWVNSRYCSPSLAQVGS